MISFRKLLFFPSVFKDRKDSIKFLNPSIQNISQTNQGVIIEAITQSTSGNNYSQIINFLDTTPNQSSLVKIYCDCPSFKFEFAKILYQNGSLYNEDMFKDILKLPSRKNKSGIITGCKHIICVANIIFKDPKIFNFKD